MGDEYNTTDKLTALIAEAKASGGSELANYQLFILGLCEALGLDRPAMAQEQNDRNDYVFERRVDFKHPDGSRSAGRIDCYRRGCFILEAKQSGKRQAVKLDPDQLALIPEDATQRKPGQAKRGTRGWDQVMLAARKQAEDYARALPVEHGYAPHLNATLKKFNGSLFKKRAALPLDRDDINELWIAAGKDWSDVEPAIFGTLLERALNTRERSKLGAHYTPRAYVERLVVPTIIEPLRADWELVQGQVKELRDRGDDAGALAAVKAYHHKLCTTRVLDPACGTGNFLYVSLELMKRLEGEVLEALDDLGEDQARFAMEGETVSPRQFYGLELNPRAVPIADLVLWIGYLKWQLKTAGLSSITEPILHAYGTIRQQDAVIAYDRQELLRDEQGRPLSRWDGVTKKVHPITGEEVPDPDAQLPLYSYVNPKVAQWPEVEFIVGNPPFIGSRNMRTELGDGYAEACWAARPHLPGGADFVMHFWDEAATRLLRKPMNGQANPLRRFGFITTNSITQTFSRRVIERHMAAKEPLSTAERFQATAAE